MCPAFAMGEIKNPLVQTEEEKNQTLIVGLCLGGIMNVQIYLTNSVYMDKTFAICPAQMNFRHFVYSKKPVAWAIPKIKGPS
jgi:hypothetical protein